MNSDDFVDLDVRPILAEGREPLSIILATVDSLGANQGLRLMAPFEPAPLYGLLESHGFTHEARQVDAGWEILFRKGGEGESKVRELDLRDLEPPGPMQTVLETLPSLERDEVLAAHTRFRPVHLLEMLGPRGFEHEVEEAGPEHWLTRIWRCHVARGLEDA